MRFSNIEASWREKWLRCNWFGWQFFPSARLKITTALNDWTLRSHQAWGILDLKGQCIHSGKARPKKDWPQGFGILLAQINTHVSNFPTRISVLGCLLSWSQPINIWGICTIRKMTKDLLFGSAFEWYWARWLAQSHEQNRF